jgi:hypothetical protein
MTLPLLFLKLSYMNRFIVIPICINSTKVTLDFHVIFRTYMKKSSISDMFVNKYRKAPCIAHLRGHEYPLD